MNTDRKSQFISRQIAFVLTALFVGFFLLNGQKCTPDPYCDPDPIRGGCSQICEDADLDLGKVVLRSLGVWVLLQFGAQLGKQD